MSRYICIHGHFYQPPRENPWLEEVELQESAYPYHDWNKRVAAECYAPNATSHIRDSARKMVDIVNIYSKISFDFGPTLLSWLQRHEPETYSAILQADSKSREDFFGGHGSAMAQPYNHMIMPLANARDKRTQVIWGIADFEHRFKRKPEGMWLPETAVDSETLDILAEHGIRFAVLAPHQALREREIGDKKWRDLSKHKLDTKNPYLCNLPSGRSIALFFYNGAISHGVAFGDLLNDGVNFANRLISAFSDEEVDAQLVNIATDGETYGHHHRFGDMALAYCLYHIESNNLAEITNYGKYLEEYPPTREVEVLENSSWSCGHGVERWRSDCGCNSGINPRWKQGWRKPLRDGMDWLRDNLARIYEKHMSGLVRDAWDLRNEYIKVVLERSDKNADSLLSGHALKALTKDEKIKVLKLLEMQRNAMFMYTSCEWFFDDISGIETIQGLQYAARALQLAGDASGSSLELEEGYVAFLEKAPSNIPSFGNGAKIYESVIKPALVDLPRVAAHHAMSSIFEDLPELADVNAYIIDRKAHDLQEADDKKLAFGIISVRSKITLEEGAINYAVLYLGNHDIITGVKENMEMGRFDSLKEEMKADFVTGKIHGMSALIDKNFDGHTYSLSELFKDRRTEILNKVFHKTSKELESALRTIYKYQYPAMQTVKLFRIPLLKYFYNNLEFALNADIFNLLKKEGKVDCKRLKALLKEAKSISVQPDNVTLSFIISRKINSIIKEWSGAAEDMTLVEDVFSLLKTLNGLSLDLNLRESQNVYFYVGRRLLPSMRQKAESGDRSAKRWVELFSDLEDYLKVEIE
ncbi:MAG: hypothetical protein A2Z72_08665 [Omnitrophica bacterium RBG_13_46_9]|nr:MAG: hypothetical protein A2Z72_08665 [Omnitrophica bacterium RBG_13_46_9]